MRPADDRHSLRRGGVSHEPSAGGQGKLHRHQICNQKGEPMKEKMMSLLVISCLGAVLTLSSTVAAAEVRKYVVGSGAMGGA